MTIAPSSPMRTMTFWEGTCGGGGGSGGVVLVRVSFCWCVWGCGERVVCVCEGWHDITIIYLFIFLFTWILTSLVWALHGEEWIKSFRVALSVLHHSHASMLEWNLPHWYFVELEKEHLFPWNTDLAWTNKFPFLNKKNKVTQFEHRKVNGTWTGLFMHW